MNGHAKEQKEKITKKFRGTCEKKDKQKNKIYCEGNKEGERVDDEVGLV